MMWYSHGNLGWAGWTLMLVSMVAFSGLVIWGIAWLWRSGQGSGTASQASPEKILARRFAAGEIDAETYRHGLSVLSDRDITRPVAQ